jgi:hypothetical protein
MMTENENVLQAVTILTGIREATPFKSQPRHQLTRYTFQIKKFI